MTAPPLANTGGVWTHRGDSLAQRGPAGFDLRDVALPYGSGVRPAPRNSIQVWRDGRHEMLEMLEECVRQDGFTQSLGTSQSELLRPATGKRESEHRILMP